MSDELRDFTTKATSETVRTKEDILALDRWESEGGSVRRPIGEPVNGNRERSRAPVRVRLAFRCSA
jgi:hypothetical protein